MKEVSRLVGITFCPDKSKYWGVLPPLLVGADLPSVEMLDGGPSKPSATRRSATACTLSSMTVDVSPTVAAGSCTGGGGGGGTAVDSTPSLAVPSGSFASRSSVPARTEGSPG